MKKVNHEIDITELYEKAIVPMNQNPLRYNADYKTCIIHMVDSVSRGYTTKSEAYEALKQSYFPEYLRIRKSAYMHLV